MVVVGVVGAPGDGGGSEIVGGITSCCSCGMRNSGSGEGRIGVRGAETGGDRDDERAAVGGVLEIVAVAAAGSAGAGDAIGCHEREPGLQGFEIQRWHVLGSCSENVMALKVSQNMLRLATTMMRRTRVWLTTRRWIGLAAWTWPMGT